MSSRSADRLAILADQEFGLAGQGWPLKKLRVRAEDVPNRHAQFVGDCLLGFPRLFGGQEERGAQPL
jgi:hypothetical protein